MPLELRYDGEKRILCVTVDGNVRVDEFDVVIRRIVSSNDYPPNVPTLWDVRSVRVRLDAESVRAQGGETQFLLAMIEMRKRYPERGNAKLAIVVPNDFRFGMSRMYEILSDRLPQSIMVFRDYAEAEQWLSDA
jgi:hypothetical protein